MEFEFLQDCSHTLKRLMLVENSNRFDYCMKKDGGFSVRLTNKF